MIFALLLAASSPNSALEAERAYSEAVLASGRQAAARSFGPQSDPGQYNMRPKPRALHLWPACCKQPRVAEGGGSQ